MSNARHRVCHQQFGGSLGFTLVEVLIALFIFSLISAGAVAALTSAIDGKAQMSKKNAWVTSLQNTRALLASDMANVVLRPVRNEGGMQEALMFDGGGKQVLLRFIRTGWINPAGIEKRGDLQRVEYVFENGELIRRVLSRVNPGFDSPQIKRVLMSGLQSVSVEFLGPQGKTPLWIVPVDGSIALPKIIAIDMQLPDNIKITQLFEVGS